MKNNNLFVQRMLEEQQQLEERIIKLNKFINIDSAVFEDLDLEDKALLKYQLSTMERYLTILKTRIIRYGK